MKKTIQNLIIFGSGPHAKLCLNEANKLYKIKRTFFFDNKTKNKIVIISKKKYVVLGNYLQLKSKISKKSFFFIGIGDNKIRSKVNREIFKMYGNVKWLKIISKFSNIDNSVKIEDGTIVLPGSTLNYNSKIGKHSIINTNSSIDHDCEIKDYVNISPGVHIAGNVIINDLCKIGIGSNIIDKIKIQKNVTIGGGSFVNKNCTKNLMYMGLPAKIYKR